MEFDWLALVGSLGTIITVASFGVAVREAHRAKVFQLEAKQFQDEARRQTAEVERMRSLRSRLDGSDVEAAARDTAHWLRSSGREVDVILAPGARGSIFGQCLVNHLTVDVKPPIVVGVTRKKSPPSPPIFTRSVVVANSGWSVELPSHVRDLASRSIVIMDDYA